MFNISIFSKKNKYLAHPLIAYTSYFKALILNIIQGTKIMRLSFTPSNEIANALMSYKRAFGALAMFSGVINLLMLLPSIYMMQVYDRVLSSRSEMTLIMLTIITLGLFLLMSLLEWIRAMILVRVSAGLDVTLSPRVFTASFERNLRETSSNPAQLLGDLATIRQFVTGNGLFAFFDVPWLPIYLFVAFLFHPILGFFTLAGILLLLGLAFWNEIATKKQLSEANQLAAFAGNYANSTLQNAEVIESMGMLNNLQKRWYVLQQKIIVLQADASDKNGRIGALTRFIRISWQSMALGVGAILVIENQITGGMMIACSIVLGRAMAPVEQAIGTWKQLAGVRSSYTRLLKLLQEYPARSLPMDLLAPEGALTVEHVSIAPPGTKQFSLRNVTFNLAPGEILGVIGPSASGKSTLARALVGVWRPQQGTVRIDNADIQQWSRDRLGIHMGYLPQDIELFNGSVAENIARFNDVDSEQVIAAAKLAGVHEMILHLPNGYDTNLGAGGFGLSGGQKQRIGLARAVYRMPALIVLDEPNSNLDDQGEAALVSAILALKAAKSTVVLITHRPSIVASVDKLLLLKDGMPQLFGPRDQVLQSIANARKQTNHA
ncbi:type I secretion system permease/ATPase [uncultured Tolumonas sp.]|uniref:type I secretion system permease/ATPase n=1 Tax=uncultured Tolumonas sp. TaxID=263765 RepID=UPI00292FD978|nr:type I secretion system permease/ATPase [uncultured Tolumonas sp.]